MKIGPRFSFIIVILFLSLKGFGQTPSLEVDTSLPIELTATSSTVDNLKQTIQLTNVRIQQGQLEIIADHGEVHKVDFEDSFWKFTGKVEVKNLGAKITSDSAQFHFKDFELIHAQFDGSPAFMDHPKFADKLPQLSGRHLEYDVPTSIVTARDEAWFSDGLNELTAPLFTYNVLKGQIIANKSDKQMVRMLITIPKKNN